MSFLRVHLDDDMVVALADHAAGETVDRESVRLVESIPAKHKVATRDINAGELLKMYGLIVGRAQQDIPAGSLISTRNLVHATGEPEIAAGAAAWNPPDVSAWQSRTFAGYHRGDGRVGTRNYWLVVPLVFCENRNIRMMRRAMLDELGYGVGFHYQTLTRQLVQQYQDGATAAEIREQETILSESGGSAERVFPNVDGVKFLTHAEGCGVTFHDSDTFCGLLAGYINHPNVAGATVLSLGCQKAQIDCSPPTDCSARDRSLFEAALYLRTAAVAKFGASRCCSRRFGTPSPVWWRRIGRRDSRPHSIAFVSVWSAGVPTGFRASVPIRRLVAVAIALSHSVVP